MKIVIIGAGSRIFGRGQIADVLQSDELKGRKLVLSLVDENEKALELMRELAIKIKEHTGTDIVVESTTDRTKALPGANYVITAVARRRRQLWEQDFRVPLAYGFKHCMGENGGPGALFHTLRSFELIIPICHDIEKFCPDALLLNFTNPEARVLNAICNLTNVKAAGICHGVFSTLGAISRFLEQPVEELDIVTAGMNHFFYTLKVKDKKTGEDLLDKLLQKVLNEKPSTAEPLFKKLVEIFGMFSYPSDHHTGEYLSFASELTGLKWIYGQEREKVHPKDPEPTSSSFEEYATGKRPIDEDILKASGEITVPIICDIELDRGEWRPAVNVPNTEYYIENLPADGIVEIPARVDAAGIHAQKVGPLPEPIAAFIRTQFSIHKLLTEAYRTKSKKLLLQALLLDPVVNNVSAAEKMLDEMLELQGEFLPKFL